MRFIPWLLAGAVLLSASTSHAAMTAVRFYHLSEGDAGLGHTIVATNSLDSVSTNSLSFTGAPKYWAHAALANTNSSFSVLFSTADQGTAAVVPETNNVSLEAWANTGWRDTHVVAYNGSPSLNGYGLVLETNTYKAVLGGVGTVGTVPCPPGEWMHLALVCNNGTAQFFTNGILAAFTIATPILPTGSLTIGGPNTGGSTNSFMDVQGFVDDVRISTFAPGEFSATDLLTGLQKRLTITQAADKTVISFPAVYSQATLQVTTNLQSTNWQAVGTLTQVGNQRVWTNSLPGDSRFYRLIETRTAPVQVVNQIQDGISAPLDFGLNPFEDDFGAVFGTTYQALPVSFATPAYYDCSASLDSLSGTSNTLSCHWELRISEANGGLPASDYGLTNVFGYDSMLLEIPPSALPSLPDTDG